MKPGTYFVFLTLFFWVLSPLVMRAQTAEMILTNGKIFTADSSQLYVEAIAIKGNRILAAGSNETIGRLATAKTKKIDLRGRTVIPGLNDAHDHVGWGTPVGVGFTYTEMNPAGLSKQAVLDSLSKLVKIARPGQWISGKIGTNVLFDASMRASLDSIAPDNPVVLQIWWGHGQVVNEKALRLSGLSDTDADPVGGRYIRVPSTNKIFAVYENAQVPVWNAWLGAGYEDQLKALRTYAQARLKMGVTTIQQMSSTFSAAQSIRLFKAAKLPQRVRVIAWPRTTAAGRQMREWDNKSSDPLIYFSGVKYMMDGTPFEENSFNKKSYQEGGHWHGWLNFPVDTIRTILSEALSTDRQLMMHITGDSTMAIILSQMKQLASDEVWKSKRVRIEHNTTFFITPEEAKDIKALGLLVMHTPQYNHSSALRSFMDKGIVVGMSPDGSGNPFWDIMVVTSQQSAPSENITREQAVIAYTRTNAFAEFKEREKGTLAKGMLADLTVLSQDIFTIPNEQLPATKSVLTMVNGKIVYREKGF